MKAWPKCGAPITDVKAALQEAAWDLDEAFAALRKRGLAAASKKASRHAAEGLIGLAHCANSSALVEVNSETDFVTKTAEFQQATAVVAEAALRIDPAHVSGVGDINVEALGAVPLQAGGSVADAVAACAGSVRENIRLRRACRLDAGTGVLASYLHASPAPGLGRMGALVRLESASGRLEGAAAEVAKDVGAKLAMHIVAARPMALDRQSMPADAVAAEREIQRAHAIRLNKPAAVLDRVIAGRVHKWMEEMCLLEQLFVMDAAPVQDVLRRASEAAGAPLAITGYVRLQVAEGLGSAKSDFASEVAATLEQTG
ncbi:hypothetical protein WJX81_006353 [Elliptochloris bilobata]|uniref:Elongation factor Ts, mitochondrial n=1 Tax=Elliptochloris bilobata TaxID=381761 RepID=A0AAW1QKI8_9CHLO